MSVDLPEFGQVEQIIREGDGKLVIAGSGPAAGPSEFGELVPSA